MVSLRTPISREVGSGELQSGGARCVNIGEMERMLSLIAGGALGVFGLSQRSLPGLGLAAVGAGLLYRGLTGHCHLYEALGVDRGGHGKAASMPAGHGVKVTRTVPVRRPASELYRFWRDFANLPRFMHHLESVTTHGNRSHWVVHGPLGKDVSWDAEIINEEPDRLIAWRSLDGSEVATAGSVHFTPAGPGATQVQVVMKYEPPAGKVGSLIAWLFGKNPERQIAEDLQRFKQLMEEGTVSQAQGLPGSRF